MQESNDSVVFNTLERFISDNLHKVVLNNYVRVSAIFLVGAAITISVGRVYNMKQYINEVRMKNYDPTFDEPTFGLFFESSAKKSWLNQDLFTALANQFLQTKKIQNLNFLNRSF